MIITDSVYSQDVSLHWHLVGVIESLIISERWNVNWATAL